MTPRFLKLAESNISSEISEIKDDNGIPFDCDKKRQDYITNFYEKLYKIPAGSRTDFANCVNDFLGNLTNHPVVRGSMLTDQERTRLETPLSLDELDESVRRCNLRSAPGIDGIINNFIKKFWPYFRSPLHDYIVHSNNSGILSPTFRTALIKLIPKKGDTSQIKNWRPTPYSLVSIKYGLKL
jgi:hypothetical protein